MDALHKKWRRFFNRPEKKMKIPEKLNREFKKKNFSTMKSLASKRAMDLINKVLKKHGNPKAKKFESPWEKKSWSTLPPAETGRGKKNKFPRPGTPREIRPGDKKKWKWPTEERSSKSRRVT